MWVSRSLPRTCRWPDPSGRYLAVAAVDVSVSQIEAQSGQETQFVIVSTLIACGVIFLSLLTLATLHSASSTGADALPRRRSYRRCRVLRNIVDQRDPYTAGHSHRVAEYSVAVASASEALERAGRARSLERSSARSRQDRDSGCSAAQSRPV